MLTRRPGDVTNVPGVPAVETLVLVGVGVLAEECDDKQMSSQKPLESERNASLVAERENHVSPSRSCEPKLSFVQENTSYHVLHESPCRSHLPWTFW